MGRPRLGWFWRRLGLRLLRSNFVPDRIFLFGFGDFFCTWWAVAKVPIMLVFLEGSAKKWCAKRGLSMVN
jgi:hypothetical protein